MKKAASIDRWGFVSKTGFHLKPSDIIEQGAYLEGAPQDINYFSIGEKPITGPIFKFDTVANVAETADTVYTLGGISPSFKVFLTDNDLTLADYEFAVGNYHQDRSENRQGPPEDML